jgi:hypothetical protein
MMREQVAGLILCAVLIVLPLLGCLALTVLR